MRPEVLDSGAMRMSEIDEIRAQYRQELVALEQKSQAEYDRVVLWLSGGAMGVSFTFVGRLIGDSPIHLAWALMVAWALWVLSLAKIARPEQDAADMSGETAKRRQVRKGLLEAGLAPEYVETCLRAYREGEISYGKLADALLVSPIDIAGIVSGFGLDISRGGRNI